MATYVDLNKKNRNFDCYHMEGFVILIVTTCGDTEISKLILILQITIYNLSQLQKPIIQLLLLLLF
jgi:hypothetical protein